MELYDHQKEAIEKLQSGSILCGGVGSGKTIAALAFFFDKILLGNFNTKKLPSKSVDLYIITTARKRDSKEWEKDMSNFSLIIGENVFDNIIFNCYIDSWNNIKKYDNVEDSFFIFDEQRVIGYGEWVKSFIKISKNNKWILLSATPGDTWMDYIPVFIANGFYKNKSDFLRKHVIFSRYTKYPKVEKYIDTGMLLYFRNKILIPMKFERKTNRNHEIIKVNYDKDKYNYIYTKRKSFDGKPLKDAGAVCLALRTLVNQDDSRCNSIKEILYRHKKAIIFYNYVFEKLLIIKWCINNKVPFSEWNGQKHEAIPNGNFWLYLVQYNAGCEGWNCIETNCIIFYSPSYSYKQMEQASGRIDRLNTPYNELFYYHLKSNAPIEIAINRCLEKKENFNDSSFIT